MTEYVKFGDEIQQIMIEEDLDFVEAIQVLAARKGYVRRSAEIIEFPRSAVARRLVKKYLDQLQ